VPGRPMEKSFEKDVAAEEPAAGWGDVDAMDCCGDRDGVSRTMRPCWSGSGISRPSAIVTVKSCKLRKL
jgi:hypothetical protein